MRLAGDSRTVCRHHDRNTCKQEDPEEDAPVDQRRTPTPPARCCDTRKICLLRVRDTASPVFVAHLLSIGESSEKTKAPLILTLTRCNTSPP